MATCDTELSNLPLLSGCPGNNEYFLVGNAAGGQGIGLYGRRLWSDVKSCILSSLKFGFSQSIVGQGGSLIPVGGLTITINQANILQDSVFVTLDGTELDRNDSTQVSYLVAYNSNNIVITFNQGAKNLQTYLVHYCYTT